MVLKKRMCTTHKSISKVNFCDDKHREMAAVARQAFNHGLNKLERELLSAGNMKKNFLDPLSTYT